MFVGVVISIVSTMEGDGYALLVDAVTFEEIARLRLPYVRPTIRLPRLLDSREYCPSVQD
jgi:hypothetical protein